MWEYALNHTPREIVNAFSREIQTYCCWIRRDGFLCNLKGLPLGEQYFDSVPSDEFIRQTMDAIYSEGEKRPTPEFFRMAMQAYNAKLLLQNMD